MVSEKFPHYHYMKGKPTHFQHKIKIKDKIHTIRGNYEWWAKRIKLIQEGKAVLSIRVWSGKAYRSPMKEIAQFTEVGIQKIEATAGMDEVNVEGWFLPPYRIKQLGDNDGLCYHELRAWFNKPLIDGCIIHFTNFRYIPVKI